ncbi:CidA/LrgA family protein [uncultured Aliivibrio sp.]|uniref:CidA/LrgA family protein n=1 Tax=uncultured Aliivibrio sp. TaxID=873085 RepID=UPI00261FED36|nr:CidA/LrgA family protein [uncultured Aliivibrio sp.]
MIKYLYSFAWIFASLFAGNNLQSWLNISVPGSILGMLILFTAMVIGVCKPDWTATGCQFFMRNMLILFIPISVGLMTHFDLLLDNAIPIIVSTAGGSLLVLICLSLFIDRLDRGNK